MRHKMQCESGLMVPKLFVAMALVVTPFAGLQRFGVAAEAPQTRPASDDIVAVHGRVLTPDGKPAVGAQVFAAPEWPDGPEKGRPAFVSKATAGADGQFQVSFSKSAVSPFVLRYGQPGGDLWRKMRVAASAAGLGMDWQLFDHRDPVTGDLVLQLVADTPIRGRIIDLEGRPVSGVSVMVDGLSSHIFVPKSPSDMAPTNLRAIGYPLAATGRTDAVVTDAEGRFEITGLGRDRRASLRFFSDKVAISRVLVGTREGKSSFNFMGSRAKDARTEILGSTFELTAPPARSLTGTVRDAQTHQPLGNVCVQTADSRIQVATTTDAQGRYRIRGLERDQRIEITARTDDAPYVPAIFEVPDKTEGDSVSLDIELVRGIWVTGKVVDAQSGAAVPASVSYEPLDTNKAAAKIPVFQVGQVQPLPCNTLTAPNGTYRVVAISGPGVVAVAVSQNRDYPPGQGFGSIKTKDANGRVLTVLPAVLNPSFYTAAREIDAAPDGATTEIDFGLKKGGTIAVACVNPTGQAVRKLTVFGKNAPPGLDSAATIHSGEIELVGLRPGETRIVVIRDDEQHVGKTITVNAGDAGKNLRVELQPMAVVTGRLLNSQQAPLAGARIKIETAEVALRQANHLAVPPGFSGTDGRFRIELPVGCQFILAVSNSPFGGGFKYFENNLLTLKAGETKDLGDVQLD